MMNSRREKKDSIECSLLLYEKENIENVLDSIQLGKKSIDFQPMSDKILTRKRQKNRFSGGIINEL